MSFKDIIDAENAIPPGWRLLQENRVHSMLLVAALLQEAVSAVVELRGRGVVLELEDKGNGFDLVRGVHRVTVRRINDGVSVELHGMPVFRFREVLTPAATWDEMGAQAHAAMRTAVAHVVRRLDKGAP
jgi:hypothetical protein